MRILCYLNISASKNLVCDSGLIQTIQMIEQILKRSKEYHFYLAVPDFIPAKDFQAMVSLYPILGTANVSIVYYPISHIRRIIPYEFNFKHLLKCVDFWKTDYDMVFNCLPEYTNNLSQLLCRSKDLGWGHSEAIFVNRWHWLMATGYVPIPDSRIEFRQVEGMLFGEYNLSLCDYTETMVEDMSKRYLNQESVDKIKASTTKLYNGIDLDKIIRNDPKTKNTGKYKILFPNRLQGFKNPMFLFDCLFKLREKRQDFELILTDPTCDFSANNVLKNKKLIGIINDNKDWITVKKVSGDEYYKLIYESDLVINTSDYETWCVSVTEALACGKLVVVPNGLTFEEMIGDKYPFIYQKRLKKSFIETFERALLKCRDDDTKKKCEIIGAKYAWSNIGESWFNFFEKVRKTHITDRNFKSPDRDRTVEFVKNKGYATKQEIRELLGPGEEKSWSRYRWHMLNNGIKDDYESKAPIFYVGDKPKLDKNEELF